MKTSIIWRILSWVVTLLVPVALTLLAIRVHFSPIFLPLEYNCRGFPRIVMASLPRTASLGRQMRWIT